MVSFRRAFIAGVVIGVVEAVVVVQLARPGRADRLPHLRRGARRGVLPEPPGRRGDAGVLVHAEAAAGSRAAPQHLVGPQPRPRRAARDDRGRDRAAADRHAAVAAPALHESSSRSRCAACRSPSSPAGPGSSHSGRWRSPESARSSPPRSTAASPSTSAGINTRLIKGGIEGLGFGPSILVATLVTAGLAALIGVGALRVRGLAPRGEHVRVRARGEPVLLLPAHPERGPGRVGAVPAHELLRPRRRVATHLLLRRARRARRSR